jgi:hypothetical protein
MSDGQKQLKDFIKDLSEGFKKELLNLIEIKNPVNRSSMDAILMEFRKNKGFTKVGRFTKLYWTQRGWNDDDAELKKKASKVNNQPHGTPMQKSFWMKIENPNTGKKYTESEAEYKIKSQRKFNIEYWIEKGQTLDEAKNEVKKFQTKNSRKMVQNLEKNPKKYTSRTWSQYRYWMEKHGLPEEDAKKKVSDLQGMINVSKLMEKYGDFEGRKRYDTICKNLSKSHRIEGYIERYGEEVGREEYNKNLVLKASTASTSKESIKFFISIYKKIRNYVGKEDIFWGISGSKEYFLWDSENAKIFFYDFTILSKKIIIEYHGKRWHPNPSWDNEKWKKWELFGMNANEKRAFDLYKNSVAEKMGFTVIEVFSDTCGEFDVNELIKIFQLENTN